MTEQLWAGEFGRAYHQRNIEAGAARWPFWRDLYQRWPVASVLEVGCGTGGNLMWSTAPMVIGIDVNTEAVAMARGRVPRARLGMASVTHLPFLPGSFDLVISCGVLIHVPSIDLPKAMDEMWRMSSKYILVMEYDAARETEVEYRGQAHALWKRPYAQLFSERFALDSMDHGFLGKDRGFDSLHYDLWRKRP